jgi:hypothetical protein
MIAIPLPVNLASILLWAGRVDWAKNASFFKIKLVELGEVEYSRLAGSDAGVKRIVKHWFRYYSNVFQV